MSRPTSHSSLPDLPPSDLPPSDPSPSNPSLPPLSPSDLSARDRALFPRQLIDWFQAGHRDMPWRRTRDPYAIWVSEIMLQQTQVATVIPYYLRFLERFPTPRALAEAPQEEVLSLWRGLGYYARARNLQKGAAYVLAHHGGRLPADPEALRKVPGIGRYTAGAILSIAFDLPVPLLDGNVARVFSRQFGRYEDPKGTAGQKVLWGLAEALVPAQHPGDYNQALMELGALVCTPSSPECGRCPIAESCYARLLGNPTALPVKGAVKERPEVEAVAVLVRREDGSILLGQRPGEGLLAGMWELPAGVRDAGESVLEAARRVGRERLGEGLEPLGPGVRVEHTFTHLQLVLNAVACRAGGTPIREDRGDYAAVEGASIRGGEGGHAGGSAGPGTIRDERGQPIGEGQAGHAAGPSGPGASSDDNGEKFREVLVGSTAGAGSAAPGDGSNGRGRKRGIDQVAVPYQAWRWVGEQELTTLPMGKATLKALEALARPAPQLELKLSGKGRGR